MERVEKIRHGQPDQMRSCFGGLIGSEIFRAPERRRGYDEESVFWAFLGQCLRNGSCRDAVQEIQAARARAGLKPLSASTASYCIARRDRLREGVLEAIHRRLGAEVEADAPSHRLWRGRPVLAVDATSVALADTPINQQTYPQPTNQQPGCGFAVVQIVGLYGLGSGSMLEYALTRWSAHENSTLHTSGLIDGIPQKAVLVQDRAYCSYINFECAAKRGFDLVARLHQARHRALKTVLPNGSNDHVSYWKKPQQRPKCISEQQWEQVAEEVPVRVVRMKQATAGFRTTEIIVATSLMDASAEEIAALFLRRWEMEVSLADLKTTLGMDNLMVRSPAMARKTIAMFMIAHNLIRWTMLQAANQASVDLQRLSFKGTVDILDHWRMHMCSLPQRTRQRAQWHCMLELIAKDRNPDRPGRSEPRVKKRRPKKYQMMTLPRPLMVTSPSRRLK